MMKTEAWFMKTDTYIGKNGIKIEPLPEEVYQKWSYIHAVTLPHSDLISNCIRYSIKSRNFAWNRLRLMRFAYKLRVQEHAHEWQLAFGMNKDLANFMIIKSYQMHDFRCLYLISSELNEMFSTKNQTNK